MYSGAGSRCKCWWSKFCHMNNDPEKLLSKHASLTETSNAKVVSHVQRDEDDWVRHTIMLDGYDVPFVFRRKKAYRSLVGARVNITYYRQTETVAGIDFESMKVVRIKRA